MILLAELLILLGSLCFIIASLGLFRMPDALARLHAATKASSLGVVLMMTGAMIRFPEPFVIFLGLVTLLLIFVTAPLASHAIAIRLVKRD
ncbi:MAG: monovalent cation/H(+) antiporter subunit G [Roseibacillus sp.]